MQRQTGKKAEASVGQIVATTAGGESTAASSAMPADTLQNSACAEEQPVATVATVMPIDAVAVAVKAATTLSPGLPEVTHAVNNCDEAPAVLGSVGNAAESWQIVSSAKQQHQSSSVRLRNRGKQGKQQPKQQQPHQQHKPAVATRGVGAAASKSAAPAGAQRSMSSSQQAKRQAGNIAHVSVGRVGQILQLHTAADSAGLGAKPMCAGSSSAIEAEAASSKLGSTTAVVLPAHLTALPQFAHLRVMPGNRRVGMPASYAAAAAAAGDSDGDGERNEGKGTKAEPQHLCYYDVEDVECVVCYERQIAAALLPCECFRFCIPCAQAITGRKKTCPWCREQVEDYQCKE